MSKKKQFITMVSIAVISFLIGTMFNVTMATDGRENPFDVVWKAIYGLQSETSELRTDYEDLQAQVESMNQTIVELKSGVEALEKQSGLTISLLPAGAWVPYPWKPLVGIIDWIDSARLDRIDLNPNIDGDQQQVFVTPGETVTIDYSAWLMGNPGEIRQLWFSYSWASSYPPWDAYTPIFNGHPSGSGTVVSAVFNIVAPSTPGMYRIWLCVQSQYTMDDAINQETVPPAMLPHAIITVGG